MRKRSVSYTHLLRGIESNGMMCSIEELGSSRDLYPEAPEYGIYIFGEESGVAGWRMRGLALFAGTIALL